MKAPLAFVLCLICLLTVNCQNEKLITAPENDPDIVAMDDDDDDGGVRIKGHVEVESSPGVETRYQVDARSHIGSIAARGRVRYWQTRESETGTVRLKVHGQVLCVGLIGTNRARVGVEIIKTNFEEGFPKGSNAIFSLTDNDGKHSEPPDAGSEFLVGPPGLAEAYCAGGAPVDPFPSKKGDVRIDVDEPKEDDD